MKKPLQSTEYMYGSARIRALENRMVGRERMDALVEAKSTEEVLARLAEYGISPTGEGEDAATAATSKAREEMLLSVLRSAYCEVETACPDPTVFRWFRYPYDCNNIKAAMKCLIRDLPPEDMFFDFGTVPAEQVMELVRTGKYNAFPPAMAQAAPVAREAYAKTGDPQKIDAILDRACYTDMMQAVKATGDTTMMGWLSAKVDLLNLTLCLRIIRMARGDIGLTFLQDSLLPGGHLEAQTFISAYQEGEEALWRKIMFGDYWKFALAVEKSNGSLAAVERCADDHWMGLVRDGARVAFGAPVLGGYLIGCENSVKNIRIVLAAKDAGLPTEAIRERIRVSYV